MTERTARCLARHEGAGREAPVLLAVSGGADSTALALVGQGLRQHGYRIHIAHIDHGQRPDSGSTGDQVRALATRLGLPSLIRRLDLEPDSSEAAMRAARYGALGEIAAVCGARRVLTAHHADDDMETVLFRLLRGTGPRGLCGMPEARPLTAGGGPLLLRPFLRTRRGTLRRMLEGLGESWHEDPSNRDTARSRNWLRHVLIPKLRTQRAEGGGSLDATVIALARSARAAEEVASAQATRLLHDHHATLAPGYHSLDLSALSQADWVFLRPLLQRMHEDLTERTPSSAWLERAVDLCAQRSGSRLCTDDRLMLERSREGLLLIDRQRCRDAGAPNGEMAFPLDDSEHRFGHAGWTLRGRLVAGSMLQRETPPAGMERALLTLPREDAQLRLRARRPGDRFQPLGARRSVDLRRFLQKRGVPRWERHELPLLVDENDQILWVCGVEVSESAKIGGSASGPRIEVHAWRGAPA